MSQSHARVLPRSDLAQRIRAGAKKDNFNGPATTFLNAVAKTLGNELSDKTKSKFSADAILSQEQVAGEGVVFAWVKCEACEQPLRLAMDAVNLDLWVELMCGGTLASEPRKSSREISFVDRAFFNFYVQICCSAIAQCMRETQQHEKDFTPLDAEQSEILENIRPPSQIAGWITLSVEAIRIRLRIDGPLTLAEAAPCLGGAFSAAHDWSPGVSAHIDARQVRMTAMFEDRSVTLAQIENCDVGSLIPLQATPRTVVTLYADDAPMYLCQLGQGSGCYTVRVHGEAPARARIKE